METTIEKNAFNSNQNILNYNVANRGLINLDEKVEISATLPQSYSDIHKIRKDNLMQEIFKPIKDYEGFYSVSNFGRVQSGAREWIAGKGAVRSKGRSFLKPCLDGCGYVIINLCKNSIRKTFSIHRLVWDHFGDKKRNGHLLQIDHIDNNKLNNRIDNLQLLSNRQNTSKSKIQYKQSSKYTGVYWQKRDKKWQSCIQINGKLKHLGYFDNEFDAYLAYEMELSEVELKKEIGIY